MENIGAIFGVVVVVLTIVVVVFGVTVLFIASVSPDFMDSSARAEKKREKQRSTPDR